MEFGVEKRKIILEYSRGKFGCTFVLVRELADIYPVYYIL